MLNSIQRSCLLIVLSVLVLLARAIAQNEPMGSNQCLVKNELFKKTLSKDNILYLAIEKKETGTGLYLPWMEKMKSLNVRQAAAEVRFDIKNNEIKLELKRIDLLSNYYNYESKAVFKTSDELQSKRELQDRLKMAFFIKTLNFLDEIKIKNFDCGELYLNLLDDACLPNWNEIPYIQSNCRQD